MKPYDTSERLKQIMQNRNLKQVDILNLCKPFCRKYNVKLNKNDLSQYVNGKATPGQDKLDILSQALNVSEAWLYGYNVPIERADSYDFVLSEQEKEMVKAYRSHPEVQSSVNKLLDLPAVTSGGFDVAEDAAKTVNAISAAVTQSRCKKNTK